MTVALTSVGMWLVAVLACARLSRATTSAERAGALAMGVVALLTPLWFPASWVIGRFVLTAAGLLVLFRTLDLILRPRPLSLETRLWFLIALFDVRRARRVAAKLDLDELCWLLGHLLVTSVTLVAIVALAPRFDGAMRWLIRWSFGAGFCYALVEVLHSIFLVGYALAGIVVPRINDFPIRSTTLGEFWGRRWNRVVAGWLRDYLFFPLARRRRVVLGICAAFAGSTAIHFWLAWMPLDLAGGLMMASFFVVQAAALLLERRLRVERWSTPRKRGWTIAWLLLSSPLFVEPALRIYLGP